LRRERPEAFGPQAEYEPLTADGARAAHVVAYLRGGDVLVVAPRLVLGVGDDWQDTALTVPGGRWQDVLTGEERDGGRTPAGALLRRFPVALLRRRWGAWLPRVGPAGAAPRRARARRPASDARGARRLVRRRGRRRARRGLRLLARRRAAAPRPALAVA